MGHFPAPLPSQGQIDSFTPPRLVPIRQQLYESSWTGRQVAYTRGMRFEGSVTIRRFGSQLEKAGAAHGPMTGQPDVIFSPALLNGLADAGDTFDLQLPLATTGFGGVTPSTVALDATTGLLEVALPADPSALTIVGAYVRMGTRLYQIAHIATRDLYLTPGIVPSANDLNSLLPSAVAGALPRLKARVVSYSLGRTERERIEGPHTFQWAEALE